MCAKFIIHFLLTSDGCKQMLISQHTIFQDNLRLRSAALSLLVEIFTTLNQKPQLLLKAKRGKWLDSNHDDIMVWNISFKLKLGKLLKMLTSGQ